MMMEKLKKTLFRVIPGRIFRSRLLFSGIGPRTIEVLPVVDLVLDGLGEAAGIAVGQAGVAAGGDQPLAWLALRNALGIIELQQSRTLENTHLGDNRPPRASEGGFVNVTVNVT